MARVVDEEEAAERERWRSVQRSAPKRRKQVSKHFAFLRERALARIERVSADHQTTLNALLEKRRAATLQAFP